MERDRAKVKPSDDPAARWIENACVSCRENERHDSYDFYRSFYRIKKLRYHKWILRMARVLHISILATGISFLFSTRWQADLIKIWMAWKYCCRVSASGIGPAFARWFSKLWKTQGRGTRERNKGRGYNLKGAASVFMRLGRDETRGNSFQFLPRILSYSTGSVRP